MVIYGHKFNCGVFDTNDCGLYLPIRMFNIAKELHIYTTNTAAIADIIMKYCVWTSENRAFCCTNGSLFHPWIRMVQSNYLFFNVLPSKFSNYKVIHIYTTRSLEIWDVLQKDGVCESANVYLWVHWKNFSYMYLDYGFIFPN